MAKIPVIIDAELKAESALALMLALSNDKLDIRGLTVVGANYRQDPINNTRRVLADFDITTGVYQGAVRPMVKHLATPLNHPGTNGLIQGKTAVQFMEDELTRAVEPLVILALGPLTNLGTLLVAAPELKPKIKEIYIRGGAALGGNQTPVAEENIWSDPEAAQIVFSAGVPIIMCGLDVTDQAILTEPALVRIAGINTELAKLAMQSLNFSEELLSERSDPDPALRDVVAVAKLLQPDLFRSEQYNVVIDLDGTYTRGCTVTDLINVTGNPKNAEVVLELDRDRFVDFLVGSLEPVGPKEVEAHA